MNRKLRRFTSLSATALLALTGCTASDTNGDKASSNVIDYWLWDPVQQVAYEQCASDFNQKNPNYEVKITQYGWDDYWQLLTAGFIADTGPDAFSDHVSQYPQFVDLNVIEPLEKYEATADVDPNVFQDELVDLWTGQDGNLYGMPKDWDTIAAFYNPETLEKAGISPTELDTWEWNPQDGGSFEDIIAHLTVDKNGVRGDEPGFDKKNVEVYGIGINDSGGGTFGQGQWASFVASNGGKVVNSPSWGDRYQFDDPKLQEAIDWYFGLIDKGYMPAYGQFNNSDGVVNQLLNGHVAIAFDGSWMNATYAAGDMELDTARFPVGPDGTAPSMMNGLGDSIASNSDNKEGAAEWIAYMASNECQTKIAEAGIVFPSRKDAAPVASQAFEEMGIPVEAFEAPVNEGETIQFPITHNGPDVRAMLLPAFEDIYANREPASSLTQVNDAINVIFETSSDNK
ncbi:ABC transporter substrate-binding protein [Rothia aerolata]|uniref:Sugar ABC transporter substrate-binding protein n=1 Tax=Rothia aerolata TaxID=1812262 RepID=A0A917IW87_9MICC|nr:sugar ABC transporter substrate-binding protein [Rothia aerolata]GGH65856.1 sugar ABC transporter substrate-binding protein [Rothia aerolata]